MRVPSRMSLRSSGLRSTDSTVKQLVRHCQERAWLSILAARSARVLHHPSPLSKIRGRRESRVFCAPAALRASEESTQASHHRSAETFRLSLRDGFNGLSRALPRCTGPFSHRRLANHHLARLDPSVGRSGPHALAVRCNNTRLLKLHRPSHLASYVRDDASAPLVGTRRRDIGTDLSSDKAKYFDFRD